MNGMKAKNGGGGVCTKEKLNQPYAIGYGSRGSVCSWNNYAIKQIHTTKFLDISQINDHALYEFEKEQNCQIAIANALSKEVREQFTTLLHNEDLTKVTAAFTKNCGQGSYIIQKLCLGDTLECIIDKNTKIPGIIKLTAISILTVLSELHVKGYTHGDIHIRNIMLCEGQIKLIDFGACHTKIENFKNDITRLKEVLTSLLIVDDDITLINAFQVDKSAVDILTAIKFGGRNRRFLSLLTTP